jgi:hypothetical protein
LKAPRQCTLALLAEVRLREGKSLGSGKGKGLESGLEDGGKILNLILNGVSPCGLDSISSVAGSIEHRNKPSCFIKYCEFVDQLSDYQLLKDCHTRHQPQARFRVPTVTSPDALMAALVPDGDSIGHVINSDTRDAVRTS